MILNGDSLEKLKKFPDNYFHSVVTDPPYGLSFMGKKWDYDVPSVELWREVLRVLKPGGHLLSFGGTRTYHRMVVNIEDAGFEIRDQIMWIYGSGFPKSHDISKAIDKSHGVSAEDRPIVGKNPSKRPNAYVGEGGWETPHRPEHKHGPATDAAKKWQGWGSALKPAFEPVVCAVKPLTTVVSLSSLARECQQLLFARIAKSHSKLSSKEKTRQSIARWIAGGSTPTQGVLSEVMATLRSESEKNSNLSTELSWLDTLEEVSQLANTYTTEMESSLTTDLKILKSLPWKNTQESMLPSEQHGEKSSALFATSLLCAVELKLKTIRISSAPDLATAKDAHLKLRLDEATSTEPIVMARKPIEGTLAQNTLKHGWGGLNIDATRIEAADQAALAKNWDRTQSASMGKERAAYGKFGAVDLSDRTPQGRFPANILFDEAAAESLGEPSRFFYVAKASKAERNAGLEGMPVKKKAQLGGSIKEGPLDPVSARYVSEMANVHPTVKPLKLMQYLIKLVTPEGGIVLDPFCGSGTTGVAAKSLGFGFVGVEREQEYAAIAEKRIAGAA